MGSRKWRRALMARPWRLDTAMSSISVYFSLVSGRSWRRPHPAGSLAPLLAAIISLRREAPAAVEAPVVEAAAPTEPLTINDAVQQVLKKALAHDGLSRGLHEAARAIEKGQGQLCVLAGELSLSSYIQRGCTGLDRPLHSLVTCP